MLAMQHGRYMANNVKAGIHSSPAIPALQALAPECNSMGLNMIMPCCGDFTSEVLY